MKTLANFAGKLLQALKPIDTKTLKISILCIFNVFLL